MTGWRWEHAEYHTHDGWVPGINIEYGEQGRTTVVKIWDDGDPALDTKAAARNRNRQLAGREATARGWSFVPAHNE